MAALRSVFCGAALLFAGACVSVPSAFTVGQSTVHLKRHRYEVDRYLTEIHEAAHRRQFRERGVPGLLWSYALRPSKRLHLEAEAHATALCKAGQLGLGPKRLNRIHERYAGWLRTYVPDKPITAEASRAYLDTAYQNGETCATLLASLDSVPLPPAYAQIHHPHPAPVVILARTLDSEQLRSSRAVTPLAVLRMPTPSLASGSPPGPARSPRIAGSR